MGDREHARQEAVVEARNAEHDGEVIQPREIAAHDQRELKENGDAPAQCRAARREIEPRHDELGEMIEQHAGFVEPVRQPDENTSSGDSAWAAFRSGNRGR